MRKITAIFCGILVLTACDKHDPILPGVRTPIFNTGGIDVKNKDIDVAPSAEIVLNNSECPYTQDSSNVIWDGNRKIFSGFATNNTVQAQMRPICSGKYIYAGLTTGEVIKLNPKSRKIVWIADIYRASNLTGGAAMVDIVAPIAPVKNWVFAGGLGDAFCKLSATSGDKKWCLEIGVAHPFAITEKYAFVVGTDKFLYAIENSTGDVFWRTKVEVPQKPKYENGQVFVGDEVFDVKNGKKILDK